MTSGVTSRTWENLLLDAAVVYLNWGEVDEVILGATNGGATFGWDEFNIRSPEIDGLKGRIKGASRITAASPQVTLSLVEWNSDAIAQAFPGSDLVDDGNGLLTVTRSTRLVPAADYPANLAMVGQVSGGGEGVIILKNPLVVEGAEIPTEEDSEATADLTFVGHYDPENPEDEPWEIQWPVPVTP